MRGREVPEGTMGAGRKEAMPPEEPAARAEGLKRVKKEGIRLEDIRSEG